MLQILNFKKLINFIIFLSLIVIILTSTPYAYGITHNLKEKTYMGIYLAPGDIFVYQSYLNQIKHKNSLLLENLFHNETPSEKNFNIFWLSVAYFGKIFHLPPFYAFHIVRILLIPFCVTAIYYFISFFTKNDFLKKIILFLALFGSGLGWLTAPLFNTFYDENLGYYNFPQDLWVGESNTFLSFYHSPHFILSLILIILIYYYFLKSIFDSKNNLKYSLLGGISALILFNFHPFHIISIFSIIITYLIFLFFSKNKKKFQKGLKYFLIINLISLPSTAYLFYQSFFNPYFKEKAAQNLCKTVSFPVLIISYGLLIPLMFLGIYFLKKKKSINLQYFFLIIWLIINFILLYLPFIVFQRRLSEGLQIPLSIFAGIGFYYLYKKIKNKTTALFIVLFFLIFISLSNIYIIIEGIKITQKKINYFPTPIISAMQWMDFNIPQNSSILSTRIIGGILPAFSFNRVYIGRKMESIRFKEKEKKVLWFFKDNQNNPEKKKFLLNNRLDYIFYSANEKNIGSFNPDEKEYLKKVFDNGDVKIYKVIINKP